MTAPKKRSDGSRAYGPYPGSKANGGRPLVVIRKADGSTTSTPAARAAKEGSTGKTLSKGQHVAHKPGTSRTDVAPSKTRVESAKKNIGDGNKNRKRG